MSATAPPAVLIEHGTTNGYFHQKCRCHECRLTARFYMQGLERIRAGQQPQPEKTAAWKKAVEVGKAEAFCDRLTEVREFPIGLLRAIARA